MYTSHYQYKRDRLLSRLLERKSLAEFSKTFAGDDVDVDNEAMRKVRCYSRAIRRVLAVAPAHVKIRYTTQARVRTNAVLEPAAVHEREVIRKRIELLLVRSRQ